MTTINHFKIKTPYEQYVDWIERYEERRGRTPDVCIMTKSDAQRVVMDCPCSAEDMLPRGRDVLLLNGVECVLM